MNTKPYWRRIAKVWAGSQDLRLRCFSGERAAEIEFVKRVLRGKRKTQAEGRVLAQLRALVASYDLVTIIGQVFLPERIATTPTK